MSIGTIQCYLIVQFLNKKKTRKLYQQLEYVEIYLRKELVRRYYLQEKISFWYKIINTGNQYIFGMYILKELISPEISKHYEKNKRLKF